MATEPMILNLHNTLTREKAPFTPARADDVRIYVCGPTVYDFAHIGNARPVIVFDVLFRLLRHIYGENHVTYVRNITDVDDKINARALRDYPDLPLNEAIRKVTEKTATQFHSDVAALGCLPPTYEPRATEFVLPRDDGKTDMVTLIQQLLDRNHAYIAEGAAGAEVLFDVTSMDAYGALSNRNLDDQQAGARIEAKTHKRNPGDFVLWKQSNGDEPGWAGVFNGQTIHGRPGWHIECSAMSAAYLGETFDIHGGGLDLIFPHHENEIAQSCCAHGTDKMASVWMHNGYLQVEGKKMSKSDGNFVTIHDLLHTDKFGGRKWPGEVLRLAMLMTHYREPIDFSVQRLEEAESELAQYAFAIADKNSLADVSDEIVYGEFRADLSSKAVVALLNDLNFSDVRVSLNQLRKDAENGSDESAEELVRVLASLGLISPTKIFAYFTDKIPGGEQLIRAQHYELLSELYPSYRISFLNGDQAGMDQVNHKLRQFGIKLSEDGSGSISVARTSKNADKSDEFNLYIERKKDQRLRYLAEKNFAEADQIRKELDDKGIQLKDGKDADGNRVTTWEIKR